MRKDEKNSAIYVAYEESGPYDPVQSERNLLYAILMSAVSDLEKKGEARKRALEFFLSPEDDYIFSFRAICSYLSVDPQKILTFKKISEEDL